MMDNLSIVDSPRSEIIRNIGLLLNSNSTALEIGALHKPWIKDFVNNVKYLDFTDSNTLKESYKNDPNVNINNIVEVDYILQSNKKYNEFIDSKFDVVFSSHNIEHQPNLIKHLNDVSSILNDNGFFMFYCPDCRYIFDKYRQPTTIINVLCSYYENHQTPTGATRFEQSLLESSNNSSENKIEWEQPTSKQKQFDLINNKINKEFMNCRLLCGKISKEQVDNLFIDKNYYDNHVSKLYPESFIEIINILYSLGYIDLKIKHVFATNNSDNCFEFAVILEKTTK